MDKASRFVEPLLFAAGVAYGLDNIQTVLGIIIMAIQLIWLLTKLIVQAVKTIKNRGNLDELDDRVVDVVDTLDKIKDSLGNENGGDTDERSKE